jgi:hypothetical protein
MRAGSNFPHIGGDQFLHGNWPKREENYIPTPIVILVKLVFSIFVNKSFKIGGIRAGQSSINTPGEMLLKIVPVKTYMSCPHLFIS